MVATSVVVGRMIVDPDHADLAQSLLSFQNALADIDASNHQTKGKGRAGDIIGVVPSTDEEYAFKMQEDFLQDALRGMEDFRLAKSLWGDSSQPSFEIIDQRSVDYLRACLTASADPGACVPENATSDVPTWNSPVLSDDVDLFDSEIEIITEAEFFAASQQAAAEHRQALLANSVGAGLPGPSDVFFSRTMDTKKPSSEEDSQDLDLNKPTESPPTPDLREVLGDQFGFPTVFCLPCGDLVVGEPTLHAACGHDFCVDCIQDLVATSTKDESLFPPQCCQQPFSAEAFAPFLTVRIQADFDAKRLEFSTPAAQRIFCPSSTCSAFLGSSEAGKTIACARCVLDVCTSCKLHAHPGETCSESTSMSAVRKLAKDNRWQTCPQCHAIVEKTMGCNHIVCRCSSNFCYVCGGKMGECKH